MDSLRCRLRLAFKEAVEGEVMQSEGLEASAPIGAFPQLPLPTASRATSADAHGPKQEASMTRSDSFLSEISISTASTEESDRRLRRMPEARSLQKRTYEPFEVEDVRFSLPLVDKPYLAESFGVIVNRGDVRNPASRSCRDVVDSLGFGLAQMRVLMFAGGIWLVDGLEIVIVASVNMSTQHDFGLTPLHTSLLQSIAYVGLAIGCFVGGWMSDTIGRRPPILIAYVGVSLFGAMTSYTEYFALLVFCRLFCGFFMGFGMPPSLAVMMELSPLCWQVHIASLRTCLFQLGWCYGILLLIVDDATLKRSNWRWLFRMAVAPNVIWFILAVFFLPESPVYLAAVGKHDLACKGLVSMRYWNGRMTTSIEYDRPARTSTKGSAATGDEMLHKESDQQCVEYSIVFGWKMLRFTCLSMLIAWLVNIDTFGHHYAEPFVFAGMGDKTPWAVALQMLFEQPWAFAGAIMPFCLGDHLSRRAVLTLCPSISGLGFIFFGYAALAPSGRSELLQFVLKVSPCVIKLFTKPWLIYSYQFGTEIYPTLARGTGSAVTVGASRIGASMSSVLVCFCLSTFGAHASFYPLAGALSLLVAVMVWTILPPSLEELREQTGWASSD